MTHETDCSCLTCDDIGRQAFLAGARGEYDNYERLFKEYHEKRGGLRAAAASNDTLVLRTGIHYAEDTMQDFTPPDPYAPALARLRAAATPESKVAAEYRQRQLRALADEQELAKTFRAATAPTVSAEELKRYAPPDGYELALAKLRRVS